MLNHFCLHIHHLYSMFHFFRHFQYIPYSRTLKKLLELNRTYRVDQKFGNNLFCWIESQLMEGAKNFWAQMSSYTNITHSTKTMLVSFWSFWMYLSFEPKNFWLLPSADSQFNKIERSRTYGLPCKLKIVAYHDISWSLLYSFWFDGWSRQKWLWQLLRSALFKGL